MKIEAGNFADCLERIAARGSIGQAEALDLLQQVADRGEAMRDSGIADPFVTAAGALAQRLREGAREDRLDALRNAALRGEILARIDAAGGVAPAPQSAAGRALGLEHMTAAEATLRDLLHGSNSGERDNVESLWKGNASRWQGVLSWRLRRAGLEKAAISGAMDRDIARELWALNAGESRGGGTGGAHPARAVAQAVHAMLDHLRERLNAAGAHIGDAADYVTTTVHDPAKLRRAAGAGASFDDAFTAWWQATEPLLAEKTFDTVEPRDGESVDEARARFGRSVFEALATGVHMSFGGRDEGAYVAPAFEGSRNLARRLSQARVLHWQDADAWHDYMQRFGRTPTLMSGVMHTLDRGARHLALLDKLGSNPMANVNQVLRRIEETYRGDADQLRRFQNREGAIRAVVAHLDGSANIPANQNWAALAASLRTWETVSDLGGVGITHFASIWPTVTSEMVHHGFAGAAGRLATLGNMVKALVHGKGDAERQEVLADLGAYAHGLGRDMAQRWQAEDTIPGRVASLANTFMKYTGIHYVFDNTQAGIREMLAHQLGRKTGVEFAGLGDRLGPMLAKYGIGAEEWDLLRAVPGLPVADGMRFLTPEAAARIDPEAAASLLRRRGVLGGDADDAAVDTAVRGLRWQLGDRLASYYNDAAAHGVVSPGVRERAAVLGSERPGSLGGELRRFLFQFKMWPLAAMHQVVGREIWLSLGARDAAWNLGTLLALTAAGGYLRMTINDVALGHEPRSPLDPRTLLAALAQGGGIGILGDFLFGEVNRMGGGLVGTIGGPLVSDADSLVNLFNRFRGDATAGNPHPRGRFADLWPELARFAVRHVPFANLVYLKGALDYLLWYHLYEAASPGWWERSNRRMQREQGRVMAGYSPGGGVPGGVPGLYGAGWGPLLSGGMSQ